MAVIPFDLLLSTGDYNGLARIARLPKLYKLIKMTRLVRMLKILKERSKVVKYLNEILKIGVGFERLLFLVLIFLFMCHIIACLWVIVARFDETNRDTWIVNKGYQDLGDFDLYIVSFYFTIATMVSVGYGDISGTSTAERFICALLEIIGVIAFSLFTGSLSSIMTNYDISQAKLQDKIGTLNDIKKKYDIDLELYDDLKQAIKYDFKK